MSSRQTNRTVTKLLEARSAVGNSVEFYAGILDKRRTSGCTKCNRRLWAAYNLGKRRRKVAGDDRAD
eukprot:2102423-Karenia_brevis.AAC.1